eukprot:19219-Heterococcus_DN1.PRE.1
MKPSAVVTSLVLLASSAEAFVPCSMSTPLPNQAVVSRKAFVSTAAASIAAVAAAPAFAEPDVATAEATAEATEVEEVKRASTRLGGLLEPYSDTAKAFRLSKPLGWNKFDNVPGEYDVKFTDIINPSEVIVLQTTAVKSDTQLTTLGAVDALGKKLAAGRKMELISAKQRKTEGLLFYDFEYAGPTLHEVRTLCVYKSKLWSLTATTPQKNWLKRAETYRTIQQAFVPRL